MSKFSAAMGACGVLLLWASTAVPLPAQTFTVLHSFNGTDGNSPGTLVQATDGNLYGTTNLGGPHNEGTVFKITPAGTLTTLHRFHDSDGGFPYGGLTQAADGRFYGTTSFGGANDGEGTVFKIAPGGTLTTLHTFDGADGESPAATLVRGTDGDFYGTTQSGGANLGGTIFKITPGGTLTTLYNFCSQGGGDCTDGEYPVDTPLIQDNAYFYGTTYYDGPNGYGTVFRITTTGNLTTFHSFDGTDGSGPQSLIRATMGNFYGTTLQGGANDDGTVFQITPGGTLTTLHNFDGTDGSYPEAGLVLGTDGNFYGTTLHGGANVTSCVYGCGTIFRITPSGTLTTLYNFCSQGGSNCTDGDFPASGLIQATDGNFYGATVYGGMDTCYDGCGTVFSLSVGLGPFVETLPTSGAVGSAVTILGTNLTGSTSLAFNGTAATFTVVSASEITTTVPLGGTTGAVQVVTPNGTLSSNVPFRVTP